MLPTKEERCGQSLPAAYARIGLGAIRRRMLKQRAVPVRVGARRLLVEADLSTPFGLHLYRHGWCDPAAGVIERLVGPGGVVVDGGANVGLWALTAADVVGPGGAVHAVEASPGTARLLRRNVEITGAPVTVHEVALADAPGRLRFTVFEPGSGVSSLGGGEGGTEIAVEATTLDALTEPLGRVDLVKLDLEGAEVRALQGATRLLSERRPPLVLEVEDDHLRKLGSSAAELETLLAEAGYRPHAIVPGDDGVTLEALASLADRRTSHPNVAFLPA